MLVMQLTGTLVYISKGIIALHDTVYVTGTLGDFYSTTILNWGSEEEK